MSFTGMLNHSALIERTVDDITDLELTQTSAVKEAAAPCHLEELSGDIALTVMGMIPDATHQIFFNAGADVLEKDRITINSVEYDAKSVRIIERPGTDHHIEVIAEEVHDV